jgi:tripartite-type tricarboxylate transporter receptor subunit TctC
MSNKISPAANKILLGTLVLFAVGTGAQARNYPSDPIRQIVPLPRSGSIDQLSRRIGQDLETSMGSALVVINKAVASEAIETTGLLKFAPRGDTIILAYSAHATDQIFNRNLPYDTDTDFTPVVFDGYIPIILVTRPTSDSDSVMTMEVDKFLPCELEPWARAARTTDVKGG